MNNFSFSARGSNSSEYDKFDRNGIIGTIIMISFGLIFVCSFISFIAYVFYEYFREGGASFLNNEKLFDANYFEIRRRTNFRKNFLTNFPFNNPTVIKAENCFLMRPFAMTYRFNQYSKHYIHILGGTDQTLFNSLIYGIFKDIKNSNLGDKLFENRVELASFFKGELGGNLNSKVFNILSNISAEDLLTENEVKQIDLLLYRIAINGIRKDSKKWEELKGILSKAGFRSPEDTLSRQFIPIYDLDHLKLIFRGLSNELKIDFNLLDISYLGPEGDIPKIPIPVKNPIKEIDILVDFKLYKVETDTHSQKSFANGHFKNQQFSSAKKYPRHQFQNYSSGCPNPPPQNNSSKYSFSFQTTSPGCPNSSSQDNSSKYSFSFQTTSPEYSTQYPQTNYSANQYGYNPQNSPYQANFYPNANPHNQNNSQPPTFKKRLTLYLLTPTKFLN